MSLLDTFLIRLRTEAPTLAKHLSTLDEEAHHQLEGVVGRFDREDSGHLGEAERRDAIRMLVLLRDPDDARTLQALNKVLDYLDFNADAKIDATEYAETMGILDDFRRADIDDLALSRIELDMLYAVLRHRDIDHSQRLERDERRRLRADLEHFDPFWEKERESNPLIREILARREA